MNEVQKLTSIGQWTFILDLAIQWHLQQELKIQQPQLDVCSTNEACEVL